MISLFKARPSIIQAEFTFSPVTFGPEDDLLEVLSRVMARAPEDTIRTGIRFYDIDHKIVEAVRKFNRLSLARDAFIKVAGAASGWKLLRTSMKLSTLNRRWAAAEAELHGRVLSGLYAQLRTASIAFEKPFQDSRKHGAPAGVASANNKVLLRHAAPPFIRLPLSIIIITCF